MIGDLVPVFSGANLRCSFTLGPFDVGAWASVAWSITSKAAPATGIDYIWLAESWEHPADADHGLAAEITQPGATHAVQYLPGTGQLYATTPRAPLLTLNAFQLPIPNNGNLFDLRVWVSRHRITPYTLWPASFTMAEASNVAHGTASTLTVPAFEGPVVCHAWCNATDPSSRIDLRNQRPGAPSVRTAILFKPSDAIYNRNALNTIVLPPGVNTVDLVNNDGGDRQYDVAFTPAPW